MNENKRCILVVDDELKMVRALHDFLIGYQFDESIGYLLGEVV